MPPPSEYFKVILCSSKCWNWRWIAAKISCNVPVFNYLAAPSAVFPFILPTISVLPLIPIPDPMGLHAPHSESWNWRWLWPNRRQCSHVSLPFLHITSTVLPLCHSFFPSRPMCIGFPVSRPIRIGFPSYQGHDGCPPWSDLAIGVTNFQEMHCPCSPALFSLQFFCGVMPITPH